MLIHMYVHNMEMSTGIKIKNNGEERQDRNIAIQGQRDGADSERNWVKDSERCQLMPEKRHDRLIYPRD